MIVTCPRGLSRPQVVAGDEELTTMAEHRLQDVLRVLGISVRIRDVLVRNGEAAHTAFVTTTGAADKRYEGSER
jgi:hypothetical protein